MAYLVFQHGDETVYKELSSEQPILIGRSAQCDVCFAGNKRLSRRHCSIQYDVGKSRFLLRDLDSLNGTYLNGTKLSNRSILANKDRVSVGGFQLSFLEDIDGVTETTVSIKVAKPVRSFSHGGIDNQESITEKTQIHNMRQLDLFKTKFDFRLLKKKRRK